MGQNIALASRLVGVALQIGRAQEKDNLGAFAEEDNQEELMKSVG